MRSKTIHTDNLKREHVRNNSLESNECKISENQTEVAKYEKMIKLNVLMVSTDAFEI